MRLFLIRHGQTPHNVAGALDTAFPGAGLTALGREQARAVPRSLPLDEIRGIYASRLVRTQQTAAPLAQATGLETVVLPGLEEISAGDLELRSDTEAVDEYADCVAAWMRGDLARRLPGAAPGSDFHARYEAALRSLAARHGDEDCVAVFSHGAAIRAYTALACRLPPETSTQLRIMNTGLSLLEGTPDTGWSLLRWSTEPIGGPRLTDQRAHDVTGESTEESTHG